MEQIHNLQVIVSKLRDIGVEIPESFQIRAIIAKLPQTWNVYQKKLLHTSEALTVSSVLKHLRIEEGARLLQKLEIGESSKVNFVASKKPNNNKRKKPSNSDDNDKKKNRKCYNCGQPGHYKAECRSNKKQKGNKNPSVNLVDDNSPVVAVVALGTMAEINLAEPCASKDWWYDSGAGVHVCNDKDQFKDYEILEGHEVVVANGLRANVEGKREVHLQFTSGKKLVLTNVLHVPSIVKNLVSADILNKKGLKAVIESDNVILSKNGVFVEK